jgi:hypothetical protein
MANLGSSSLVKKDSAACAHDAATLGPIAEAKNATYTSFLKSKTLTLLTIKKVDFISRCHEESI